MTMKNNPPTEAPQGVFLSTLGSMNDGQVLRDLDDALREVTRACQLAIKKGKVVLQLEVIPSGTGVGDTPLVKIIDTIKTTLPQPARDKQPVFFVDEEGNPTRRNPAQQEMQLAAMDGGAADKPTPALAKSQ